MRTRPEAGAAIAAAVGRLEPDLVSLRRDVHRHPELAFAETRTAALIADRLGSLGLRVHTGVGGTGVLADLDGVGTGPMLLIRADLDALPVMERTGLDYASAVPGVMHACGHDAHVAALLGAATILADERASLHGTVRLCFQPAEEILRGAEAVIAGGAMEGVDQVLGMHVLSALPFGTVTAGAGEFLSGADFFEIRIAGAAGHAGMPHLCVDPIVAAAHVVTALQSIVAREIRPGDRLVVSVAAVNGGAAANVAVEEVTLLGNVRWFDQSVRERALERIRTVTEGVCSALRTRSAFRLTAYTPVTANGKHQADVIREVVAATRRARIVESAPITASDDFAYFLQRAPGVFVGIGAGGPASAPHHHPRFAIDERAIALTAEVLIGMTRRVLALSLVS